MSRLLLISSDPEISKALENISNTIGCQFSMYNTDHDPLDIASQIFSINPSLLVLDDDFISPNTKKLLESVKKVDSKLAIILLTSNDDIEFGRSISNIGVKYYVIKPIMEDNLKEYIISLHVEYEKNNY